jgi:DNA helicase HerA-like ATPase
MEGLVLGYDLASDDLVAIDFFGFPNNNNVIVGRSGSGKSFLIKAIISLLQWPAAILIIDPNPKREYQHIVPLAARGRKWDRTSRSIRWRYRVGQHPTEFTSLVREDRPSQDDPGIMVRQRGWENSRTVADLAGHLYRERWGQPDSAR